MHRQKEGSEDCNNDAIKHFKFIIFDFKSFTFDFYLAFLLALQQNKWVVNEQKSLKYKTSQGFPDILEIVQKSRSGVKPCDDLKFSEIHRWRQPDGGGKFGNRDP